MGFLLFYSQIVRLQKVFMQRLWDFVNEFPYTATKLTKKRIPTWVREDLAWWNKFLSTYNGVLFYDTFSRHTISLYIDACFYGLGDFIFKGKRDWPKAAIHQPNIFCAVVDRKIIPPNRKMAKDPSNPSINVYKVEVILLVF